MSDKRRDGIIDDAQFDIGTELDSNWAPDSDEGLCNDDTCRHDECDCWGNFEMAVRDQLRKQIGGETR